MLELLKSAAISMVCYNYFFTQPYHTLAVNNPGYLITFSIMLATSFLTNALTTKEKLLTKEANERGIENQIHRSVTEPEELRRRFTNLRVEFLFTLPLKGGEKEDV